MAQRWRVLNRRRARKLRPRRKTITMVMPPPMPTWAPVIQEMIERDILELTRANLLVPVRPMARSSFDDAIDAQRRYDRIMFEMTEHLARTREDSRGVTIELFKRRELKITRRVLQTGECSERPLTEAEAQEEGNRGASIGVCVWQCPMCFSEDGEAFWHVAPIKYGVLSTKIERRLLADDIKIENENGGSSE